ncbi:MAG: hypothetical protein WA782_01885 [Sulfitobacter sp.]
MRFTSPLFALVLAATPSLAAGPTPLPLTYETFEASVTHVDLAECPASLVQKDVFCRATLSEDQIHVFVFSFEGDSPLVAFDSFNADSLAQLLN